MTLLPKTISLKKLIIICFCGILCISNFFIFILFNKYSTDTVLSQAKASKSKEVIDSVNLIENKLDTLLSLSSIIIYDNDINRIVNEHHSKLVTSLKDNKLATSLLTNYSMMSEHISSINIYLKDYEATSGHKYFKNGQFQSNATRYGLEKYEIYEQFVLEEDLYPYCNSMYINIITDNRSYYPTVMTLHHFDDIAEQYAILSIIVDGEYLFGPLEDINSTEGTYFFVVDNSGRLIYSPYADYSVSLDHSQLNYILDNNGEFVNLSDFQDSFLVTTKQLKYLDWHLINLTSKKSLTSFFKSSSITMLYTTFIITLFGITLCIIFSKCITLPISCIISNFEKVEEGNFDITARSSPIVEIHTLNSSFNNMINYINNLLDEINTSHEIQKKSELKALQAQINPHFLYNTLDAVYWMTDNEDIASIIHNLGNVFRLSLNKGENLISIAKEIEQVRCYINIYLIRFNNQFTYEEHITGDTLDYFIPKLILQPLVENSILHGFRFMETGGQIQLTISQDEDSISLSIEDNGIGIPENLLENIINETSERKSYGLKNVYERLKLHYGEPYGLSLSNKSSGGTKAIITVPLCKEDTSNV